MFCSKTMPAMINRDNNGSGWSATMLAPGNSDEISGAIETALALYWAACHGKAVEDVYDVGERLGKQFGYHVNSTEGNGLEDKVLQQPTDVLKWQVR